MAQDFLYPGGILSLPREAVVRLLKAQNGDAALYYLALLSGEDTMMQTWPRERLETAHACLVSQKLLDPAQVPETGREEKIEPDAPPEYEQADVTLALRSGEGFPLLVSELERRLGRQLSTADLKTLLLICNYLALPTEVILLLVSHCMDSQVRKYGAGRKPSMSQIKKEAFYWHRLGIDTIEGAEAHLKTLTQRTETAARILPLVGIIGRNAVDAERRYLDAWSDMGFEDEAIRLAYEKTVLKKQGMNWPYMNSILRSWSQKGLRTKAKIVEKEQGAWKRPAVGSAAATAPISQERMLQDFDRLDRLLEEQQKKE